MAAVAGTKVGTGYVQVEPEFAKDFQEKVGRKLNQALAPAMQRAGRNASREIGKGFDRGSLSPLLKRFEAFGSEARGAINKGLRKRGAKSQAKSVADGLGLDEMSAFFDRAKKDAERSMPAIERLTSRVRGRLRGLGGDFRGIGSEMRKLAGTHLRGLAGEIKRLAGEFQRTDRRVRVTSSGFGGFDGVMSRVNRGAQFFRNVLRTIKWPVFIAGLGLSLQGLSALAAGAVATAGALGSLSGALVALPASALAAAQAFSVLKLATAGIGDALKAGLAAQIQGGAQAVDTMRQQEDAAERVADAKRNLASVEEQAEDAVDGLREAREAATRQLEDMRIASERSVDSEQGAVLQLRQARRDLAKTLRDSDASGLDIRLAEEAVDQARHDLEQTRVDAKRARADYRDAQRKGVEGMPEVVAAKKAEKDANQAVADANRDLERAVRDSTAAMEEQGGAATAFHEKMSQLPAAAQKFVRVLIGMKPRLDALRETAAGGFFPGAEDGLKGLMGNFKEVRGVAGKTAATLGQITAKAGRKLGSGVWGRDLTRLGALNTRILERMGDAGLNLGDSLRHVLVSAEPFLDWLGRGTEKLTEWVRGESAAARESGRLAAFFDRTRQTMERLGPILKGVGGALLNISEASRPLGNQILDALGGAAEGWRKWTDSTEGQNRLKQYFTETKPAIFEMGRLIRDAGKAFFELGRQRGVAHLLRLVRTELIPAMRDLVGVTTGWASSFLKDFGRLRDNGVPAFDAFVQVLAEHAAEAGVKIAKALVKGFVNSDVWGKLAIGGFLFSKFGGVAAFDRFGKNAGRRFATGFLLAVLGTELAKEIKQIVEGHKLDAPKSEEFSMYLKDYFEVDAAKIIAPNRVKLTTALGSLIFNSQTEKVVRAQGKKLQQFIGQTPDQIVTKFQSLSRLDSIVAKSLAPLPANAQRTTSQINHNALANLDELIAKGGRKGDAFAARVGGSFGTLAGTVRGALANIGFNVDAMLQKLGATKASKFQLKAFVQSLPQLKPMGRQEGGPVPAFATGGLASVVPGNSTGDRHTLALNGVPVAKVESREGIFVGNRNLMGALQQANEAVPRFQKGGQLGREPQIAGPAGALRSVGQSAIKHVFEGAQDYLRKHKPIAGGGLTGSGPVEKVFADVAKKLSRSKIATLALGMAGFAESRMRDLPYGDSSSEGSLQLLAPTADSLGIDPHDEGAVASQFFLRGFYGRGGANSLAAKGLPAHLVAQNVQGSAFSDGSNYLAQEGPAKGWMRRFGLQSGGLLKGLARGGLLKEAVRRLAGGGMVDPSWDPGSETIAGSIAQLVGEYARRYDIDITAGYDPSGHVSPGHLTTGTATDVVPRSGNWDGAFAKGLETLAKLGFEVGYDGSIPGTEAWPDHGRGNHAHIEWVGNGTAGDSRQRLREYLGGVGAPAAAAGPSAAPKEKIPAVYRGAKTGNLQFGAMPKSLEGVNKEIAHWQAELGTYRKAKRHAEKNGKPGVAQAVGQNAAAIEARLKGLRERRTGLRLQKVRKALGKRLKGAFGKFEGYEQIIEGNERAYTMASQFAEQVVALEPQSPELPASATDAQREAAEREYVAQFTNYVEGQERPAYTNVLGKVADWRNSILRAEKFGFGKGKHSVAAAQTHWEKEVRGARQKIDHIKVFSEKVSERVAEYRRKHGGKGLPEWLRKQVQDRDALRKNLPILQMTDSRLSGALAQAREMFFPGGGNRLTPPTLPLPGSGSLEEKLSEVQGVHWPDMHNLLSASDLAPPRVAGRFGGVIWDVQTAIEELGLRIRQAAGGLGGGSAESGEGENEGLLRELLTHANQEKLIRELEQKVIGSREDFAQRFQLGGLAMPPYAGKAHTGAIVPGPRTQERTMIVKGREGIFTEEQMAALGGVGVATAAAPQVAVTVYEATGEVEVKVNEKEVEAIVDRKQSREARNAGRIKAGSQGRRF